MRWFFRFFSYLFHPIFIPLAGTVSYFLITPKYTPLELVRGNILPVFILTIIIPVISYFILYNLGVVRSVFLLNRKERMYPLLISSGIYVMILVKVIPNNYTVEIYYYFIGLLAASLACLLLLPLKIKTSLHMMGMGSFLMYLINLSIHFEINIIIALSFFTVMTGLVATSRLFLNAHNRMEVAVGLMIGLISQLLTVRYWL